jgi:hypothetical protein
VRIAFGRRFTIDPVVGFRPTAVVRIGSLTFSRDVVVRTDDSKLGRILTAMQHYDLEVRYAEDGALLVVGSHKEHQSRRINAKVQFRHLFHNE